MKITIDFGTGRLGNQLFYYCACRYFANKLGCGFYMPSNWMGGDFVICDPGVHPIEMEDVLVMKGVFQNTEYLNKDYFKLKYTHNDLNIIKEYSPEKYVYLHVRGGDYRGRNFLLSTEYFKNAKSKFSTDMKYLVITDDIDYATSLNLGDVYISNNTEIDFKVLSLAKYSIIPNSTFSWWAMYLNKNLKKCIAPNRFLNYNSVEAGWFPKIESVIPHMEFIN